MTHLPRAARSVRSSSLASLACLGLSLSTASFAFAQARTQNSVPQAKPQQQQLTQREARPAKPQAPSIERFMKIRAPNSPTLAPDGTLYVRDWPDGVNQLYMRPAGAPIDAPMVRLTNFADGLNSYQLSHNAKHIILSAATGGSEQDDLHLLEVSTGKISTLMTNPAVVYSFQLWLHDDSGFLYTANDESSSDFYIYKYDLASRTNTKLLAKPGHWAAADITRDGSRALVYQYVSQSHADAHELELATSKLTSLNIPADQPQEEPTYNAPAMYLPGERAAAIVSDVQEGINRLFVRELDGSGRIMKPLPGIDAFPVEGGAVNQDRTLAAIQINEGGYSSPVIVRLPGFEQVSLPEMEKGVVGSVEIRGSVLTYTLSNPRTPGLSYSLDLSSRSDQAQPRQLTKADEQGIDLSAFTLPQLITYKSFDGREIPAFLYTPPGYKSGTAIPFVANYHGGPESQFRPNFGALNQYLLANGFGVIQPNVRGSTGYGREFHMLDNYKARWDSVRDGVEAVRWLVNNGYTKPGMVAAYGGSYGGFMAVATVIEGQQLYGASINVVGIVNFKTFLEQTKDYRRKLREAEYGPLSDPEFLESISPINRIEEINVPMLIAHGLNDPRVPVGEAMQLAVGLQKRGFDPELLYFPDEGHGFAKLDNRLLFAKRMVKFLNETIAKN